MIRLNRELLLHLTDESNERNVYVYKNPLARRIFWDRLRLLEVLIKKFSDPATSVLDFGGGSGVFAPTLASHFTQVDIVDRDGEDAVKISKHLDLDNVTVISSDVHAYTPKSLYKNIVAADVLEHFADLESVVATVSRLIADNGYLFVSLPTENWIYCLGRAIVRKQKPADHYHDAATVLRCLERSGFEMLDLRSAPNFGIPVPLFSIATLRKIPSSGGHNYA